MDTSLYLQSQYTSTSANAAATAASNSVSGLSENSSREEIEDAVKSFEQYMVEQVIKEFKESIEDMRGDDEEDNTMSMYEDYFMDSAIQLVAQDIVDVAGETITDDWVESIMRTYGITDTSAEETEGETAEETADSQTETTAETTAATV